MLPLSILIPFALLSIVGIVTLVWILGGSASQPLAPQRALDELEPYIGDATPRDVLLTSSRAEALVKLDASPGVGFVRVNEKRV
ncbi:MAG: hypothetical protein AAGI01_15625, partial [Myxococcota bacterium]